jgi:hypothetical protein
MTTTYNVEHNLPARALYVDHPIANAIRRIESAVVRLDGSRLTLPEKFVLADHLAYLYRRFALAVLDAEELGCLPPPTVTVIRDGDELYRAYGLGLA